MTLTLTPEMEALVKERLTHGQFTTPEEVVAAGLRLLHNVESRKESELRALLNEAEEDARSGRVAPFDPMATAARVKAARAARAENKS
ncbi:MAG: type II toxin-antitoxin system ParD family antitoxin [Planctomycetes bacterium]|nr:type II toxin-antitoxin system ParD family antitoxin [Planctomycetota bacterium]